MSSDDQRLTFRLASAADVPAIVRLLADDFLGSERESAVEPLPESYLRAFQSLNADPNNELLVATRADEVVATLQLTFTPSLSYRGSWRATLESVRTAAHLRGHGIGAALVAHALERARARGCRMVQLSTHKARTDARRFYERLGFEATHEGMKLSLSHSGH